MTVRRLLLAATIAACALAAAPSAQATNECRGLNPCVAVAGPWVVVPTARSVPRPQAQYQLTCPRGFVVGGLDAELTDASIDLVFLGASGSPVSPGLTTSRSLVFVATYVGPSPHTPTFRPQVGCIPSTGGGRRTPTGVAAIVPPGKPTVRRVITARVTSTKRVVVACRAGEQLVDWYASRGLSTPKPPSAGLVASLSASAHVAGGRVVVVASARRGQGIVQVAGVCAGGGQ